MFIVSIYHLSVRGGAGGVGFVVKLFKAPVTPPSSVTLTLLYMSDKLVTYIRNARVSNLSPLHTII